MQLQYSEDEVFTDEEMRLINRMTAALRSLRFPPIMGNNSRGKPFMYEAIAFLQPKTRTNPLRINFRAENRITRGSCNIGPEAELNEELFFDKEEIKYTFYQEIESAIQEFQESMRRL